jgi:hypothetical protein
MDYIVLKPADSDYPQKLRDRLGKEAPVLYARGRLDYLSRWTMAFLTADVEPGNVTRGVWDMFFPVLEMEMNAIGPWQSVNEGVFFRSALEKPWISLTLFTARGIESETFESFLDYRHRPPQHSFIQRPEYERRSAEGELLLLSISPPQHTAQTKDIIMIRNWIVCNLADAIFIGGAEKKSLQWSARLRKLTPRRQKTFALSKRLIAAGIPVFTVDHPDNMDLIDIGIQGYKPKDIQNAMVGWGSKRAIPGNNKKDIIEEKKTTVHLGGARTPKTEQLSLF